MLRVALQFSHSIVSNSLRPHGLPHARLPCPSPTPRAHSNSCPSHQWCHPTISSSVIHFSSCLQSFPASGCLPRSWFFASGGQSIGVSASTSVLPMNIQDWSPSGWTGWISLQSKGLKSLLQHHCSNASILQCSAFFTVQLSHLYVTTRKNIALTRWTFVISTTLLYLPLWAKSLRRNGVALSQQKSPKCNTWMQFQVIEWSVCFQGKSFNITVIQVCATNSSAEEAEVGSSMKTYKTF